MAWSKWGFQKQQNHFKQQGPSQTRKMNTPSHWSTRKKRSQDSASLTQFPLSIPKNHTCLLAPSESRKESGKEKESNGDIACLVGFILPFIYIYIYIYIYLCSHLLYKKNMKNKFREACNKSLQSSDFFFFHLKTFFLHFSLFSFP